MGIQVGRRLGNWVPRIAVLLGLMYSLAALNSVPAYAVTCTCSVDHGYASQYCIAHYGGYQLSEFVCPDGLNPPGYYFVCATDPGGIYHGGDCNQPPSW